MNQELKSLIAISHFYKLGPISLSLLRQTFTCYEEIYFAENFNLANAGLNNNLANELVSFRKTFDVEGMITRYNHEGINFITLEDESYPALLRAILDPPPILFYKGDAKCLQDQSISVVGSRKFTSYGKRICNHIVYDLAFNGAVIVSGLALGIDALAHWASLKADGLTIGVLGSGIDEASIYPATNRNLAKEIIMKKGLIISEFPLGTPPLRHHFPRRNRIIAGLSRGTLVIEAKEKSGTLITANLALDLGREVFAVPGNIYEESSSGAIQLLKQGAVMVTEAQDAMNHLGIEKKNKKKYEYCPENETEKCVLEFLTKSATHTNKIIELSGLSTQATNSTLTILEIKGVISQMNGCYFLK